MNRGRVVTNFVRTCGQTALHTCSCKILQKICFKLEKIDNTICFLGNRGSIKIKTTLHSSCHSVLNKSVVLQTKALHLMSVHFRHGRHKLVKIISQ